ncbi:glycine/betaine ABC transporter [Corynebacterium phocae]|uniref:Glycine/betaine ABC transporter n=1 Tax=Corynebacterium phocae TaxID=161895 RepID=A0A1L7D4G6_9CORY|nr:BCCT family transporter [Corynebacterium phocae]APT92957.1 glycine/betaine ABC transporter [Corynebacterium phocae]KAA8723291.1 BCCT family transporter [Corynebacterium phocae]
MTNPENNLSRSDRSEIADGTAVRAPEADLADGHATAYDTVDEALDSRSAHSELQDLLAAKDIHYSQIDSSAADELDKDEDTPVNWGITAIAAAVVVAVVAWGLLAPDHFADFAGQSLGFVMDTFGWAFVLFGTVFVVFVIGIAFSKFGAIRLGEIDEQPEFSTTSWIAMMFAAGMGIGLMFYGASEPLNYYKNGVPGHGPSEVGTSMATAMFHWTLHPWAVYAIVGLAIAYSTFRMGRKQLLSQAFVPLLGERGANGPVGTLIDVLSIIATVFGTAASLGIGATQIRAGLEASGVVENPTDNVVIGIVLVLTLGFLISAMSGVGKGIQYISNANMVLAVLLAIFVFIVGPTVSILNLIPGTIGNYLNSFTEMIGRTAESNNGEAAEWLSGWTIFYWAWWISWSPFVGMFLARISRGRSVREFCLSVMLVPAGVSTIWFAIFGGTAIHLEQANNSISGETTQEELFNLLQNYPGGFIAGLVALVLLSTFFITSADSASTVMGSMSQNGAVTAKAWLSAMWGVLTAAVGLTLLLSGEAALSNLQTVTIVVASPFLLIIIGLMFSIFKDLRSDIIYLEYRESQAFQRKLARERRLHREQQRAEALKRRRAERLKLGHHQKD